MNKFRDRLALLALSTLVTLCAMLFAASVAVIWQLVDPILALAVLVLWLFVERYWFLMGFLLVVDIVFFVSTRKTCIVPLVRDIVEREERDREHFHFKHVEMTAWDWAETLAVMTNPLAPLGYMVTRFLLKQPRDAALVTSLMDSVGARIRRTRVPSNMRHVVGNDRTAFGY
jgi:hypothetical protein